MICHAAAKMSPCVLAELEHRTRTVYECGLTQCATGVTRTYRAMCLEHRTHTDDDDCFYYYKK